MPTRRLATLATQDQERQEALRTAEGALQDWQLRWDAYAKAQSESSRWAEVERTKIEYLEKQSAEAARRRDVLTAERAGLDTAALASSLAAMVVEHDQNKAGLDDLATALEARKVALAEQQERQRQMQAELSDTRKQIQAARGRLASLEALQHAALGQEKNVALDWLKTQGIDGNRRLGEALEVEAGWETAVETVLGSLLEAVTVDSADGWFDALGSLSQGRVALVSTAGGRALAPAGSLASKVKGPDAVLRLLAKVRVADDSASARALLAGLGDDEAVILRSGEWLGNGWLRVVRSGEAQQGALARESEIKQLRAEIEALGSIEQRTNEALTLMRDKLLEAEQLREDAQRTMYLSHRGVSELAGQLQGLRSRLETAQARVAHIDTELATLGQTLAESQTQAREARTRLSEALQKMTGHEDERQQLDALRRSLSAAREAARDSAREAREAAHQLALTLESQRARVLALTQSLARMGSQRAQLELRLNELLGQLAEGDAPITRLQGERQTVLDQRVIVEKELAAARSALDGIDNELRKYEQVRQQCDQQALAQREAIGSRKLEEQAISLKAGQLSEAIIGAGLELDAVLQSLPEAADFDGWSKALADIDAKMRRLEPVNLAAIQEYGEQSERKVYLDAQNADLTQALETLEERHQEDRPRDPRPLQGNLRPGQCRRPGAVSAPVRRRPCLPRVDRRGPARHRRFDHGASARQAGFQHLAAVRRREGADRGRAGVRHFPAQSGAFLPARRSRCAAGRGQRRPLLGDGDRDEREGAVPVRHPQQGDHGSGQAAVRRDHARARRQPPGLGGPGRGVEAGGCGLRLRCCIIGIESGTDAGCRQTRLAKSGD